MLDTLENRGFVVRTRLESDRRAVSVALTQAGYNLVTHAFTIIDVTGERVAEGEMVIFTPQSDSRFTLAGHLMAGGLPR